jgi:hypothetical protein
LGLCVALLCSAQPAAAADQSPGAVFTNKGRFRIPFRYDPAEMQRLQAHEVQLYVSTDRGLRWRLADRAEPRADHFDFLAPADGEYWFAVRTLDSFNRLHPSGNNFDAALKVIVDATPPVLELMLTELEPGKVELRWTAADDHLDVSKLRIEYRAPDSSEWQPAAVVPQPSGQTTWEVKTGGVVAVRGTISDLGGNSVTADRELTVHPSPHGSKGNETEYRAPVAKATTPAAGAVANVPIREAAAINPPTSPKTDTPPTSAAADKSTVSAAANKSTLSPAADNPPASPAIDGPPAAPVADNPPAAPMADNPPSASMAENPSSAPMSENPSLSPAELAKPLVSSAPPKTPSAANAANASGATSPPAAPSGAGTPESSLTSDHDFFLEDKNKPAHGGPTIQPRARNELVADTRANRPPVAGQPADADAAAPADPAADAMDNQSFEPSPAAVKDDEPRTIVVNRTEFQIGYRIDDLGPSGLGKVEMFITTDNGRKWYRYGTNPTNKSPFPVSVPADGTYGFELRVRNGAGIGDDPPHPGDKPSIVVVVDKTPPTAQLLPPQIGRGRSRNKVLLRWAAEDAHFGPSPVLLEYAVDKAGPWQKIADWLPNSGRYIWSIDGGMPGKVYVRLTVKDQAGNATQMLLPDQLVIDFTKPTAHIVDVEASSSGHEHD